MQDMRITLSASMEVYLLLQHSLVIGSQSCSPDLPARGFPGDWKLPLLRLPSQDGSLSLVPLSPFSIFNTLVLPPFEDDGLLFWVPDVRR